MMYLEKAVRKIPFSDAAEQVEFLAALKALADSPKTVHLLQKNMVRPLYFLYLSLMTEQPIFRLLFKTKGARAKTSTVLLDFFLNILGDTCVLARGIAALQLFLWLCDRKRLSTEQLRMVLGSRLLDDYQVTKLERIKNFQYFNLVMLIEFYHAHAASCSAIEKDLIFDILYLLQDDILQESTVDDVATYLKDIVPVFVQRFAHRQIGAAELFQSPQQFATWFTLWLKHQYHLEENLAEDDLYYQTDFCTIIKYVPEYIWWNDGLRYRNGAKGFYFGSPEFRFLATGGSVRKAPIQHPFSRRMAREFVNLPYHLDLGSQQDTYLYLYGKSLGAGHLLACLLMEFMRHPDELTELQAEMQRWNPIIQKLAAEQFEQLAGETAKALMGFIYHCLRDQQSYQVQGRSLRHILADSDAYYQRITERTAWRAEKEAERLRRLKANEVVRSDWKPSRRIRPYVSEKQAYSGNRAITENYKIIELTNEQQLQQEGKLMKHCVGSYTTRCRSGYSSIWSLRQYANGMWRSLATMEIDKRKTMLQMSGKYNARPSGEVLGLIKDWVLREGIRM